MSSRQFKTERLDATGGNRQDSLNDVIPTGPGIKWVTMQFIIENKGIAFAHIMVAEDVGNIEDTPIKIPPTGTVNLGPYRAAHIPILNQLAGSDCFITPVATVAG